MAAENGWRARKIQAELSKLGIELGFATISRYLPKADAGRIASALDYVFAESP